MTKVLSRSRHYNYVNDRTDIIRNFNYFVYDKIT